jgi:DASS family divalent anion:Na+ symporter
MRNNLQVLYDPKASIVNALSGFGNSTVAYRFGFCTRGFIKTGLEFRIAYNFIKIFGKAL